MSKARVISPTLHHVNLKTTQLQAMVDWYGMVVGSKVIFRFPAGAWLSNDAANHRIALLALGYEDDRNKDRHTGLHHTAFEYGAFDELMDSFERLRELGIRPEVCLDHGMTVSMYYRDPDRNLVELQCDVFGAWDKSKGWMETSPDFAANPIGVYFDPDKLLAAHRAGGDLQTLHRRMMASEFLPNPVPELRVPDPV